MTLTPQEWKEMIESDEVKVKDIKRVLIREIQSYLADLAPGMTVSTNHVVQAFFPSDFAALSRSNHDAQKNLSLLILQIAASGAMDDCCVRGEVNGQYMGKPKRPWIWFAPVERECCPMCGQIIEKEAV